MWKITHHSTSSTIQLTMKDGETESSFWFDYYEWEEFIKFIKKTSWYENVESKDCPNLKKQEDYNP